MVAIESPLLSAGFLSRGWPLVIASLACGIGSLVEVWRLKCTRAAIGAGGAVATVIWGWGISQYPAIIPPGITAATCEGSGQRLVVDAGGDLAGNDVPAAGTGLSARGVQNRTADRRSTTATASEAVRGQILER